MPVHPQGGTDSILLAPDRTAATATRAATVDTRGASYATIRVCSSSAANTNATTVALDLQDDDTTVVSNFATIVAQQTVAITSAFQITYHVDLRGKERYLRLLSTPATTTNDAISLCAIATLFRQGEWPSAVGELSQTAGKIVV